MVLLTMTPAIVDALASLPPETLSALPSPTSPPLASPQPGHPISHTQLIHLSQLLKARCPTAPTLASLLQHTTLYVAPPPPQEPKSPAYHALMAQLRAQEEARAYERMLHPPPTRESFNQRFPSAPNFSLGALHTSSEEDDLSYDEVHRQIILIINVLVSIVCVAVFIWIAARHWSVGKRLGLSMGGSGAVAIAEVAVYSGYVRKVQEAKRLEKKKPEIKEIVATWVVDKNAASAKEKEKDKDMDGVRFRKGKHR